MKSDRTWAELSSAFTKLLERLRQPDFPSEDDWALVYRVGTLADANGRPSPLRMKTSSERCESDGDSPEWDHSLDLESFGPSTYLTAGPRARASLFVRPWRSSCPAFPHSDYLDVERYTSEGDCYNLWARDLEAAARFLEMTWGPLLELDGKPEPKTMPTATTNPGKPPAAKPPDDDPDYQPASAFPWKMRPRLREATAEDRKKKVVRFVVRAGVKYYSRTDAKEYWPQDFRGDERRSAQEGATQRRSAQGGR